MRVKLTKRTIDAAKYQSPGTAHARGAHYLWDSEVAGFGLRVYPSGRKSFLATYRVRGKQRFFTLGRYGELTVQQARTKALELLARARQGDDPATQRVLDRKAPTVRDLIERYMKEHALPNKKPSGVQSDEVYIRLYILPKLGKRKVADLTRDDIEGFRPELADRPSMFNGVRGLLSCALNLAELWGWRPEGSNPCRHVKRFKPKKRERYLSQQELVRLSNALAEAERSQPTSPAITAIRLLLLTGCRSREIRTLRWEEVDFERKCLRLADSKTGAKVVYLNNPALQVLTGIEPERGNPYVFPGSLLDQPIADLWPTWERIRQKIGLEDLRLHDLRHHADSRIMPSLHRGPHAGGPRVGVGVGIIREPPGRPKEHRLGSIGLA